MSIVGWDDNFKKENFPKSNRPSIDGAWIVRDAQGEYFGDKGYFYVSFQSDGICEDMYVFNDVKKSDYYSGIYQNELYGLSKFESYNYMAEQNSVDKNILFNRSVSTGDNQKLESVGFYTTKPNAEYEIYFIDDFDDYMNRVDGKYLDNSELLEAMKSEGKIILYGTMKKAGYHTIEIPDEKKKVLNKSDVFAFGIYVKNSDSEDPEHKYDIAVEGKDNYAFNGGYTIRDGVRFDKNKFFCLSTWDEGNFEDLVYGKIHPAIKVYYNYTK